MARHDPMLKISKLRLSGEVEEVRAADLQLSLEESLEPWSSTRWAGLSAGRHPTYP